MINKDLIKQIVEDSLENESLFVVDIAIRPGNIIVVELDSDESNIGIDDCVALSKKIESQLDRDVEDFELEVGSVGLTTPFVMPRQYIKNIGNDVEVLSKAGVKLSGVLKSADDNGFVLTITKKEKPEGGKRKIEVEEDLNFAYEDVKYTKYLIRFK